ncbi:MarR family winged helix-turn-helix transcriptional regulator [Saccharomonospora saliphila]|uniref:MarR family winged helix-turn-helix transcriptional regulator n=1 Tax=Saccharomonospora saliphila TaxID=369829 RepID=UPI00035F5942|nr:MarR family transcriptional regulator [Saccharomonospora saliphila]
MTTEHDGAAGGSGDPTELDFWGPLRDLRKAMDDDIGRLYAERGVRVQPRYTMPLIRLGRRGPMTIRALAGSLDVTHSAMSQTVSLLKRDGLVTTRPGTDARTREVVLTDRARRLLPFLEAEWRATEEAAAELDAEIPYSLRRVVRDMEAALSRRSFKARIARHLAEIENARDDTGVSPEDGSGA